MGNHIKHEVNKIEIPEKLSDRSRLGISEAKKEIHKGRKRFNGKIIGVAAALFLSFCAFVFFNSISPVDSTSNTEALIVNEDGSVEIPVLQLPEDTSNASMIGLIVYNGKIYTQTKTEIDAEDAKALVGEKLGMTTGTIDEWSKQEAYDEEFASTIGVTEVFSVKGYDKDFRIMAYLEQDGVQHAEFFENLNGITISSGKDVFGKLNMSGNVSSAEWQTFSDWDNGIENYKLILDMTILNTFLEELNKTKPLPRKQNSDPIEDYRNDEVYREMIVHLDDGSNISLTLLKEGYIYYGFMGVYFEMNEEVFTTLWSQLQ